MLIRKIRFTATEKQDLAWRYLHDDVTEQVLFGGGAGGGKTKLGCSWIIKNCLQYEGSRWIIARKTLKSLKESTLLTFFEVLKEWGIKSSEYLWDGQDNVITFLDKEGNKASEVYFKELDWMPSDPNYDRLGSTEFTGGFIDEVNQVTSLAREVVTSRLRYKLDEFGLIPKLFMSCNPDKGWIYLEFYKPWKDGVLPAHMAFVQALVQDNPFAPKAYVRTLYKIKDKAIKERLLFGNWEYDDDPNTMMEFEAIADIFVNDFVETGKEHYLICDVARKGSNRAVFTVWYGWKVVETEVVEKALLTKDGLRALDERATALCRKHRIPRSHELYDEDGVGGGIVDFRKGANGFIANSKPIKVGKITGGKNDTSVLPNYENLKTQCAYALADKINEHEIAVTNMSPDLMKELSEELEQVKKRDADKDGSLKIRTKDEMKKILNRSPDILDTFIMRMRFALKAPVAVPTGVKTKGSMYRHKVV